MRSPSDYVLTWEAAQIIEQAITERMGPMRSRNAQMVAEFRRTFKKPIGSYPSIEGVDLEHHGRLLAEEVAEALTAIRDRDPVELLDGLVDIMYVAYGCAIECGFDLDAGFAEVHRSNMSKLGADGKPILREDGKILKGPNYSPPDLRAIAGINPR